MFTSNLQKFQKMKKKVPKRRKTLSLSNNNNQDLISSLPEPILHHILSFLPTKDAVKTTTLSKTWGSAFKSFPSMVFDQYSFQESRKRYKNIKNTVGDFCMYVDESIAGRKGLITGLEQFKLFVNFHGSGPARREYLDRWLDFAVDKHVGDLVLSYYTTCRPKAGWRYVVPRSLFRALPSLRGLDLFGCRFVDRSGLSGSNHGMVGSSLKKLKLSHVYTDQETLNRVISQCHILEELSIVSCKGFGVFEVSTCPKLEILDLYLGRDSEVQVVAVSLAPNLRSVRYGGGVASVHGSVMASEYYGSVRELMLHNTDVRDEFFRVIPEFGRLERLEIERCCLLESIRISSGGLSELSVRECVRLREIELDTHRLSRLRTDDECDVRFVRSI